MAGLTPYQDATHRSVGADEPLPAPFKFGARTVAQIGPMALTGVQHQQTGGPSRLEQATGRGNGAAQVAHIVTQQLPEPARFEEVALHVDDDQRRARPGQRQRKGPSGQFDNRGRGAHCCST